MFDLSKMPTVLSTMTAKSHPWPAVSKPVGRRGTNKKQQNDDAKICVVMVGLPARGKSLIAGKGRASELNPKYKDCWMA